MLHGIYTIAVLLGHTLEDVPSVRFQINITPMQQIGSLKSGLVCAPSGKLRWKDVARESEQDIADKVWRAFLSSKLSSPLGPSESFIRGKVVKAEINLCTSWHGIGRKPKGSGTVSVIWERYNATGRLSGRDYTVPILIAGRDPRENSEVLTEAVIESAQRFLKDES